MNLVISEFIILFNFSFVKRCSVKKNKKKKTSEIKMQISIVCIQKRCRCRGNYVIRRVKPNYYAGELNQITHARKHTHPRVWAFFRIIVTMFEGFVSAQKVRWSFWMFMNIVWTLNNWESKRGRGWSTRWISAFTTTPLD